MEQALIEKVVGPVVKFLTDYITRHLGYAICSTKHVNNMKKKLKVLEDRSTDVKRHMDTNNKNDREIPTGVSLWLNEVEDLRNKVQNISSDGIGCLNMKMRYRAGRKACNDTYTIEELITQNSGFIWTDAPKPTGIVDSKPESSITCTPPSSINVDVFKSRDKPFNNALEFLQQDNNKSNQVIALCGMGGVGKTTMMEQLKTVAHDKKMFDWIVKVVIGRSPNMISIQNDIALCLGGESLREATETARADSLNRKFKKILQDDKKKILVILDDVWEKIELKNIGLTSPLSSGLKLLLTSRDFNVCKQITADVDSTLDEVRVDVLEEAEAQNFFFRIAGLSGDDHHENYSIGCDIVKKCGGLPLAIKIIASTLKSQGDYVWRDTHSRLKNNHFDDNVQEVIKISYEYMKNEEDKEIFLCCGLFPEDWNISIEDLTRQAWGLKLLKNISTLREARDRTNTCVSNLINANLLMDRDGAGFVKMHDLVLAFVLDGVGRGNHPWIINNHGRDRMSGSCERISLTCMDMSEFPEDFKYPDLSLLQLMDGDLSLKFREDFYEHMQKLEVILFYNMQYPLLPRSLQCSTNLKTLCLKECKLMFDCSFVGDFVNLEVLSFADCGIRKLPFTIGNLRKLKLLDLTGCVDLLIDDGIFKNLENLEELYMRVSYTKKAIRFTDGNFEELEMMLSRKLCALEVEFVDKKTQLKNMSFQKLDKFKISIGCLLEGKEYDGNTLKLEKYNSNELLNFKISALFKKTEKLHLQVEDMICLEDVVSHHLCDQLTFCSLRNLEVSNCVSLKYLFPVSVANGLRKLKRLTVLSCSVLEALVHDYGSEINCVGKTIKFEELEFLSLQNLPILERLSTVENVVELPQLVELEVDGLPKFTSIFPDGNSILNSQVRISELRKLKVKSMKTLTHIWVCRSEEEVNNISMLREIEVEGCDSLVNLFPTNPMRLLSNLENLRVKRCGSIEVIFNIDLGCVDGVEQLSNSRLKSIYVSGSEKLREVWRIKGGENNSSSINHGFEAVERITINNCMRFRNVFTPTETKFDMRAVVDINSYDNRENGRNKESISVISIEEIPEVIENIFNVAFPSSLIPTFPHQLSYLNLNKTEGVKVLFEISNGESATPQDNPQQIMLFPNLKDLRLNGMKRMTHVWKCNNWNKFLALQKQHPQSSFNNLTTIYLVRCNRIKYLFSPLMAKLLSNVEEIEVSWCEGIEEVVSNRDDKVEDITTTTYTHTITDLFPHLHSLSFRYLRNLKRIGGGEFKLSQVNVASWSLCQYSKEIQIKSCDTLSTVFETQGINNNYGGISTNIDEGNDGTNTTIQRLANIIVPQLFNLKKLVITSCNLLQHVFNFSMLESLKQLEELEITKCDAMKVIVTKENREHRKEVGKFPHLKSLKLCYLPNLKGFFLGMNNFEWPSLEKVMIVSCPKMMVFTSSQSTAPKLEYMHTIIGKHSLECGLNFYVTTAQTSLSTAESTSLSSNTLERLPWSFHNLIELNMEYDWEFKAIIPSKELQQLQKLESIQLKGCFHVEEVFEVEAMEGTSSESQIVVEIPNLRQLELTCIECLKYIWNQKRTLMFPNLTTMSICDCEVLEHVFTSSMVGSLQQLQELEISDCPSMEAIVRVEEESELEGDAKVKENVTLPCLKSLKLKKLKSLKGFCLGKDDFSCPSLHTLKIKKCPQITVFTKGHVTTPALNIIDTSFGRCYVKEDLNSFIKTIKHERLEF